MFEIERYHDISMGHRVHGHESKCAHLHGHNYRVHFSVVCDPIIADVEESELDSVGRVIDFSVVKERLCMWLEDNWDHKFLVSIEDPWRVKLSEIDMGGVVWVPFNPTAENMAQFLVDEIGPQQLEGTGVKLTSVRIEETRKCSATYKAT